MATISELIDSQKYNVFSGRKTIIEDINNIINTDVITKPIINLYGVGGIGKTSILTYTKNYWQERGIPSATIDFREGNFDVFEIIQNFKNELLHNSVMSDSAFANYYKTEENANKILTKLFKQINKSKGNGLLKQYLLPMATAATEKMGETAGESVGTAFANKVAENSIAPTLSGMGGVIGGIGGAIVGAGVGVLISKFIEHTKQEGVIELNRIGLSRQEVNVLINYKTNLVNSFIEGINNLANNSTRLILGFDTFEKVSTEIELWLKNDFISKLNNHKIIIFFCGKESLTDNILWSEYTSIINYYEIKKFSTKESIEYLTKRQITDVNMVNQFISIANGLPFKLATYVDMYEFNKNIDINAINESAIDEIVIDRFINHISDIQLKSAILFCSVTNYFNFNILSGFFSDLENTKIKKLFEQVCKFSFTRHLENQQFVIHDEVSSLLIKNIKNYSIDNYTKYNEYLSNYFSNIKLDEYDFLGKAKAKWESIFYSLNSNEEETLNAIDSILSDATIISLDVTKEYIYKGIISYSFQSTRGKQYRDYADAYLKTIKGEWIEAELLLNNIFTNHNRTMSPTVKDCTNALLSEIYLGQGKYSKVKKILEEIIKRNPENVKTNKIKKATAKLCEVYAILGEYKKGEQLAIKNKEICQNIEYAWACKSLGDIYRLWGKPKNAISVLEEGLQIFIKEEDNYGEAVIRTQLARNFIQIGKWEDAENELTKSEKIYTKYDNKYGLANCILFKGNIERLKLNWTTAETCYLQAYELHKPMNSFREIAPLYGSLGLVYYHLRNLEESKYYFDESLKMKKEQEYYRGVSITLIYRGDCALDMGNVDCALSYYDEAKKILKTPYPIYVKTEIAVKTFICELVKNGIASFNESEYNKIENNVSSNEYYNLLTILKFKVWELRSTSFNVEQTTNLINNCLSVAKTYNDFYYNTYKNKIIQKLKSIYDNETLIKITHNIC